MNRNETMNRIENAKQMLLSMQRHSWEHGTAMNAILETGDMKTLVRMAIEAAYRHSDDGRTAMVAAGGAVTDPVSPGTGILAAIAYLNENKAALLSGRKPEETALGLCEEAIDGALEILEPAADGLVKWVRELAPRSSDGILYHIMNGPEFWADSMYMLPPYLAAAGMKEEAVHQMKGYFKAMFDPKAGLLIHIANEGTGVWTDPNHWATGNGWALMGLAMLLSDPDMPESDELQDEFLQILTHMLPWQLEDGRFHDILDDASTFVDTAAGMMTAAAVYRGVRDGWLSKDFLPAADRMRIAAEVHQDAFGFIRESCGAPHFNKSGISPESTASFIIMETLALALDR